MSLLTYGQKSGIFRPKYFVHFFANFGLGEEIRLFYTIFVVEYVFSSSFVPFVCYDTCSYQQISLTIDVLLGEILYKSNLVVSNNICLLINFVFNVVCFILVYVFF